MAQIQTIYAPQTEEQLKKVFSELTKHQQKILELSNMSIDFFGGKKANNPAELKKSIDTIDKLNKKIAEQNKVIKELQKLTSKQEKTEKQLQRQRLSELKLQQKRERAFDSYEKKLERANKAAERQAILTKKNNREYNKLQSALTKLTNEAQDVLTAMFNLERQGKKNTKEYENLRLRSVALVKSQQILDKGIKDVDAALGKHQRNVGNYSLANQNMIPILSRVDYQLQSMGLSLDTLSGKNAFKQLANGVMGMGKALIGFMLTPLGAALSLFGGLFALISSNKQTVIDFDSGLKNVGKTTGLTGRDLSRLGEETVKLSRRLEVVDTTKLQEYQTVAGQLGVKGVDNIIKFSESLAKLETASNIQGEQGASEIARFLTLTDGGVQNVKDFGDEIVILGNNFAATEAQILSTSLGVAQNAGVYNVTRQQALALGTAMAAVGVETELAGSVIGRTFGQLAKSIRTGKNLETILKLTGGAAETLGKEFKDNSTGVFVDFVSGLNKIYESGGDVNEQLDKIGITAVRDQRVLGTLAAKGYGVLAQSMVKVSEAGGAMDREFMVASSKLENVSKRVRTAWNNIVLSIDSGEGIFSKLASLIGQRLAVILEDFNTLLDSLSVNFTLVTNAIKSLIPQGGAVSNVLNNLYNVAKNIPSPFRALSIALDLLSIVFLVKIPIAISKAVTAFSLLRLRISSFVSLIKETAPIIRQIILDFLNPFKDADTSGLAKALERNQKEYLKNATNIKKIGNKNVKDIVDNFNKRKKIVEAEIQLSKDLAAVNEEAESTKTTPIGSSDENARKQVQNIEIIKTGLKNLGYTQDEAAKSLDNVSLSVEDYSKKVKEAKEVTEEMRAATVSYLSNFTDEFIQNSPLNGLVPFVDGTFERLMQGAGTFQEKFAVAFNSIAEAAQQAFSFIDQLGQQNFNAQYQRLEEQKDFSLKFAGDSATAREEIERQYEQRRQAIQRKQAEAEKRRAVFNSVINTAQAVVGALARLPDPSAVPLSIIVGAIGAAQTALIASQPIPQFWQGGVVGGKQDILVNDDPYKKKGNNWREVVKEPNGKVHFPQRKNTKMNVAKGSVVYPTYEHFLGSLNSELERNYISMGSAPIYSQQSLSKSDVLEVMTAHANKVVDTINNRNGVLINIDENGINKYSVSKDAKRKIMNSRYKGKGLDV